MMAAVLTVVSFLWVTVSTFSDGASISRNPQSSDYDEGNALAYMFCIIEGVTFNMNVYWLKDNDRIEKSSKYLIEQEDKQFGLTIYNIERSDDRQYRCVISDNDDTITSASARLTVNQIPSLHYPRIDQYGNYRAGVRATVSCITENTTPTPILQLFRAGVAQALYTEVDDTDTDFLTIVYSFTPTADDNTAKFMCQMTIPKLQKSIPVRYGNASINVQFPPIIYIQHEKVIVAGKVAILICERTSANPDDTKYKWRIKKEIPFSDNYMVTEKIVRIINPTQKLNGTILVCIAKNSIGTTEKEATLYVSGTISSMFPPVNNSTAPMILNPAQPNVEEQSMDILLKTVIIAGMCTIAIITLLVLPLCIHHLCTDRYSIDAMGRPISQPQIYFEAHDRVLPTPPENMDAYTWKRSLAVQVPDDLEIDIELVYQEISEKSRSNRSTLAKTTSTYS